MVFEKYLSIAGTISVPQISKHLSHKWGFLIAEQTAVKGDRKEMHGV